MAPHPGTRNMIRRLWLFVFISKLASALNKQCSNSISTSDLRVGFRYERNSNPPFYALNVGSVSETPTGWKCKRQLNVAFPIGPNVLCPSTCLRSLITYYNESTGRSSFSIQRSVNRLGDYELPAYVSEVHCAIEKEACGATIPLFLIQSPIYGDYIGTEEEKRPRLRRRLRDLYFPICYAWSTVDLKMDYYRSFNYFNIANNNTYKFNQLHIYTNINDLIKHYVVEYTTDEHNYRQLHKCFKFNNVIYQSNDLVLYASKLNGFQFNNFQSNDFQFNSFQLTIVFNHYRSIYNELIIHHRVFKFQSTHKHFYFSQPTNITPPSPFNLTTKFRLNSLIRRFCRLNSTVLSSWNTTDVSALVTQIGNHMNLTDVELNQLRSLVADANLSAADVRSVLSSCQQSNWNSWTKRPQPDKSLENDFHFPGGDNPGDGSWSDDFQGSPGNIPPPFPSFTFPWLPQSGQPNDTSDFSFNNNPWPWNSNPNNNGSGSNGYPDYDNNDDDNGWSNRDRRIWRWVVLAVCCGFILILALAILCAALYRPTVQRRIIVTPYNNQIYTKDGRNDALPPVPVSPMQSYPNVRY
ncbi:hypothetical protein M3Y94_00122200 [Aphelenchoides besseyi]|nr:hypothetical protein M3Y94_00122200 [Aphelenchoides besseyi]